MAEPSGAPSGAIAHYHLACRDCGREWTWEYEIRTHTFGDGTDVDYYLRDGQSAAPPWSGIRCPHCSRTRVVATPVNECADERMGRPAFTVVSASRETEPADQGGRHDVWSNDPFGLIELFGLMGTTSPKGRDKTPD